MAFIDDKQSRDLIEHHSHLNVSQVHYEHCLQAIFNGAMDAMLVANDEGHYIDANPAACELLGLPKDQLLGQQIRNFAVQETNFEEQWQAFLAQGQLRGEFQLLRADGTLRIVEFSATANILPHCHLSILRDISDRKRVEAERNQAEVEVLRLKQGLEQQVRQQTQALEETNARLQLEIQRHQATEAELHQSKQQLQSILHDLEDIIWSASATTFATLYVNSAIERISGYDVQTFLEQPGFWFAIMHPDDRERVLQNMIPFRQTGKTEIVYRIICANGETRWIRARAQMIYDEQQQPLRIEGIATDITQQKLIEQERDLALQRLNMVLERLPMGCIMNSSDFRVSYWNASAERIFGYTASEVLGKLPYETFVPESAKPYVEEIQRRMMQGDLNAHATNENVRKDGSSITCEWYNTPLIDDNGQFLGFFSIVQDISDRKRTEEALRKRDEMLQKLSEQIPGMIYQFQYYPDGRCCFPYASEGIRDIYGVSPAEVQVTAEAVFTAIHPEDLPHVVASIQHSYETLEIWHDEYRVVLPDKGIRWLEGQSRPEQLPDNSMLWHGYIRDTTERKQIEQDVRQQAERLRLLIAITQHIRQSLDLKTILATTVEDVLSVLGCDRVLIYRLYTNGAGSVETEALAPGCPSLMDETYITSCRPRCQQDRCHGPVHSHNDTSMSEPADCPIRYLLGQNAKAQLTVNIFHQDLLWGMLVAHQCDQVRVWQSWERDLLQEISEQVSIAIHQAHLFQQIQQFNVRLEHQVEERTAELQQSLLFESLLKRMTDRVRDSLDEDQILQAAVQELAVVLNVACCDAGIYSADHTSCTITHESAPFMAPAKGKSFQITRESHIHLQLLAGQPVYVCLSLSDGIRDDIASYSVFACPLLDNHRVIGNLWLFKAKGALFNDLEMRLVQQVANQCAIALRQSRLYQAAQAQVRELERLNQLKDDFLNTVSHELRTPMSNIKMATQMLEIILREYGLLPSDGAPASPLHRATQYFQILNNECRRETNLINDLLDLSRLEAEADPLIWSTIRLQDWLPAIAEPFEQKIQTQHQTLQFHISPELPSLTIDLQYLERILTELLQNACKYSPARATISISAIQLPHPTESFTQIQITVCNTGIEIPARELACVFDKFYRVPNHDPWKHGGTGLGLALIHKLVERLQGTITAESGDGETRFIITVPQDPLGDRHQPFPESV